MSRPLLLTALGRSRTIRTMLVDMLPWVVKPVNRDGEVQSYWASSGTSRV